MTQTDAAALMKRGASLIVHVQLSLFPAPVEVEFEAVSVARGLLVVATIHLYTSCEQDIDIVIDREKTRIMRELISKCRGC